ncbi:MAG: L-histidine N(alpha)-methyltransferase [Snowella sp.]|nr:L-histidine N(alpha)-methyltransferase [Snowella sp.]
MATTFEIKLKERLTIENLLSTHPLSYLNHGEDVISGLTQSQKSLPPHYFYDDQGSILFEQICTLPEYYPTRTEASLLKKHSLEIATITGSCDLIELGSGSSTKTRFLLDAYQQLNASICYLPIDVSPSILASTATELLTDYPRLTIHGLVSTYQLALEDLPAAHFPKRLIAFLGSTLGNFSPMECDRFFEQMVKAMNAGDYFLLGIDLQKDIQILEAAYNDSQGVTAAFNLNILHHLNTQFSGNFNVTEFKHHAFYHQERSQIEMHLISQRNQSVKLKDLALMVDFEAGESILTEISRKFNLAQMENYLDQQRLKTLKIWTDANQWFGLILCQFVP